MFNKPWETSGDPGRALIWDGVPVLFFCFCLGISKCPKFQTAQPCIEPDAMFSITSTCISKEYFVIFYTINGPGGEKC